MSHSRANVDALTTHVRVQERTASHRRNVGTYPAFHQFMQYVAMVCDMASLHFEGESE